MISIGKSLLVVVDVQGKLAQSMHGKESLFLNITVLIQIAKYLQIPILYTEQVPEKIGATIPEITQHLNGQVPVLKKSFSCFKEEEFKRQLKALFRKEVILCGIETHVCVYQTAADLMEHGYKVVVVADAVSSRTEQNRDIALDRLRQLNIPLLSTEMLAMELIRTSQHPEFKNLLELIK